MSFLARRCASVRQGILSSEAIAALPYFLYNIVDPLTFLQAKTRDDGNILRNRGVTQ